MWLIDPVLMCRQHLLGEHREMHTLVGALAKGRSIAGHIERGQIDTRFIRSRHDELVREMLIRGYKHKSPLEFYVVEPMGEIDVKANLIDLANRCPKCYERIEARCKK